MLESKFEMQHKETESLQRALSSTGEIIEDLKLENTTLQAQLTEHLPLSSTPFCGQAPSLQDELAQANGMSIATLDNLIDSLSEVDDEDSLVFHDMLSQSVSSL